MQSLSVKYRPHDFNEICGQSAIVKILEKQIQLKKYKHSYLFTGPSGTGKTTLARILASKINGNLNGLEELDAASNNGVDNVRNIVKLAKERSVDSEYKIFIIDECHVLTSAAWQAFLKCIEEPPEFTIFIFCTTDPQKIPDTIINRCQRYNLSKISNEVVEERLRYICSQENFTNFNESVSYLTKIAAGGMRDAISLLEKAASFSSDLALDNVMEALGLYSYDKFFSLVNNIIDGKESDVISAISDLYYSGNDLSRFVDEFFKFCLDITKYSIFGSLEITNIPLSYEKKAKDSTNFDNADKYYMSITNKLLNLKNSIKNEPLTKEVIEVELLNLTRCEL